LRMVVSKPRRRASSRQGSAFPDARPCVAQSAGDDRPGPTRLVEHMRRIKRAGDMGIHARREGAIGAEGRGRRMPWGSMRRSDSLYEKREPVKRSREA
jgi:hypothetical protein